MYKGITTLQYHRDISQCLVFFKTTKPEDPERPKGLLNRFFFQKSLFYQVKMALFCICINKLSYLRSISLHMLDQAPTKLLVRRSEYKKE